MTFAQRAGLIGKLQAETGATWPMATGILDEIELRRCRDLERAIGWKPEWAWWTA